MLDIQLFRTDLDGTAKRLSGRGFQLDVAAFSALENERKAIQVKTQEWQAKRNRSSKLIGHAKAKGEDVSAIMAEVANLSDELKAGEAQLEAVQGKLQDMILNVPNLPHISAPAGKSSDDNAEVRRWGTPRRFEFDIKDHVDIGANLRGLDFAMGTKLAGARFTFMKGCVARLHRAIAQFMLDTQTQEHGYTECYTPYLVNADSMRGTGQLPKFKEDLFVVPRRKWVATERLQTGEEYQRGSSQDPLFERSDEEWYLIPTSEVSLTNTVRGEILKPDTLNLWSSIVSRGHLPFFLFQ